MTAASVYGDRLDRAQASLRSSGAAALLIGVGADLTYLTGYSPHLLERLTMLVLTAGGHATLVAPRLEAMAAAASPAGAAGLVQIVGWDETESPHALVARRLGVGVSAGSRVLVSDRLWATHVFALSAALPEVELGLAGGIMRTLRMGKDPAEIELLRRAAHAADRVVAQIAAGRLVGRTEADVSREVRDRLIAEGHDSASFAIVASGPNSASPHHEASDRVIEPGDPIVLDIGGTVGGYGSDITRMLWVTGGQPGYAPTPDFLAVHELVQEANAAATAAVRPGVACEALDEVARRLIRDGGHGDDFIHRLGHGIGLEAHEDPYLVAGNAEPMRPGYAFSIEPGIYLAGRFGARIEDIVVCTDAGADVLNEAPRELLVIAG
jgi:Xaa-Pro aminopeptidase